MAPVFPLREEKALKKMAVTAGLAGERAEGPFITA
jgi:hypothetical protein